MGIGFEVLKSDPSVYIFNGTAIMKKVPHYDISYAVKYLERAMSKPSKVHMGAANHLLR